MTFFFFDSMTSSVATFRRNVPNSSLADHLGVGPDLRYHRSISASCYSDNRQVKILALLRTHDTSTETSARKKRNFCRRCSENEGTYTPRKRKKEKEREREVERSKMNESKNKRGGTTDE